MNTTAMQQLREKISYINSIHSVSGVENKLWMKAMEKWREETGAQLNANNAPPPLCPLSSSPMKTVPFDTEELMLLLTPQARTLMSTKVYNTVEEQFEPIPFAENADDRFLDDTPRKSVVYFTQYFGWTVNGELTVNHLRRFCDAINVMVANGDIFHGCLLPVSAMPLMTDSITDERRTLLIFYPLARRGIKELNAKYHFFTNEGELPKVLDEVDENMQYVLSTEIDPSTLTDVISDDNISSFSTVIFNPKTNRAYRKIRSYNVTTKEAEVFAAGQDGKVIIENHVAKIVKVTLPDSVLKFRKVEEGRVIAKTLNQLKKHER